MKKIAFRTIGHSTALTYARNALRRWGYEITSEQSANTTHILLPVPSLDAEGRIHGGPFLQDIVSNIDSNTTIIGGLLPDLNCKYIDLLKDPYYLAENAAITAHCAVRIALNQLNCTLSQLPVLIIGWGRIGKCLAQLLRNMGASVTVATRSPDQQAILQALGYQTISSHYIQPDAFGIIYNTAPAPILKCENVPENTLMIDLASTQGLIGDHVLWERGLPNRYLPESSGLLIAKTALRYALEKE